jgi:prevent-host-death family protein
MFVNTDKMIPVTKLQRELTQKLREVHETGEPLFVLRNNELAAVILSSEEYEILKEAEDVLEHLEIADGVERRLKGYDKTKNVSWHKIKKKYAL